jgi:SulP family sulfate permease
VTPESELDLGADSITGKAVPEGVVVFRMEGPFFFGAAEKLEEALLRAVRLPRLVVFRMRSVPAMDATGLRALEHVWDKFRRDGVHVLFSGVQPQPMKAMFESGLADRAGLDNFCANIDAALGRARALLADPPRAD